MHYTAQELMRAVRRALLTSPSPDRLEDHQLHLTWRDEAAILGADRRVIGDGLLAKIVNDGVRSALPRFLGIEAVWGCDERSLHLDGAKVCDIAVP